MPATRICFDNLQIYTRKFRFFVKITLVWCLYFILHFFHISHPNPFKLQKSKKSDFVVVKIFNFWKQIRIFRKGGGHFSCPPPRSKKKRDLQLSCRHFFLNRFVGKTHYSHDLLLAILPRFLRVLFFDFSTMRVVCFWHFLEIMAIRVAYFWFFFQKLY